MNLPAPQAGTPDDGWIGTPELPGYRAGRVVVRLAYLPGVDPAHLYFDLLLLDTGGHAVDNHSGPCPALGHDPSLDERSRFVRVVAELLRHAVHEAPSLAAVSPALTSIREQGVATANLVATAQLLDAVSSERGLAHALLDLLALSIGEDEAAEVLRDVQRRIDAAEPDEAPLIERLTAVVRRVGKTQARRVLREATDFALVPQADMYRMR